MKICFKFHQNHTTNNEFDFWGVKGRGLPQFQKFGKAAYRMHSHPTPKVSATQLECV